MSELRLIPRILLLLALSWVIPLPARAQLDPFEKLHSQRGPVNIEADEVEYDKARRIVHARGNAKAWQADFSLAADEIVYEDEKGRLEAVGRVFMREGPNEYRADRMVVDTEAETGVLINGEIYLAQGNALICGSRVEKLGREAYNVEEGSYTTCSCPPDQKPSWEMEGTKMKVRMGEHGRISNALLRAKGIPVFFAPVFYFPAPRGRQSGFIFPEVAWTSRRGTILGLPFYWATARNVDMTVTPRWMQKQGAGGETDLRYILSRQGRGDLHFSYFNEFLFERLAPEDLPETKRKTLGEKPEPPAVQAVGSAASLHRWELRAGHAQSWTPTLGSSANLHLVSDDLYLELASRRLDARKPFTSSSFNTSKGWRATGLNVSFRYYQDLVPQLPPRCGRLSDLQEGLAVVSIDRSRGECIRNGLLGEIKPTYHPLPEVTFGTSLYDRDLAPLGFTINSTATHFVRLRDEPVPERHIISRASFPLRAYRLILSPSTGLPYDMAGYANGTLKFETDQNFYYIPEFTSGTTQGFGVLKPTVEARTALFREFNLNVGRLQKIRHVVYPTLRYIFVQPVTITGIAAQPLEDRTLLERQPDDPLPPEPGGGGPEQISVGIFSFDGKDGAGESETLEIELLNQFPIKFLTSGGAEAVFSPFELKLIQPININELRREDARKTGLRDGFESHFKYNLSAYQKQKQAEQLGLLAPRRAPTQEAEDIVFLKDVRQPFLPMRAELRTDRIRNTDVLIKATLDPYYHQELHEITTDIRMKERFRFRRVGVKYTFRPRSTTPINGLDPDKENRDNPFYFHSQYVEPTVRFYVHPRFVIGADAQYDIGFELPYHASGRLEYYSGCGCWSAFLMGGRNLFQEREAFTLQGVVDADGRPELSEELVAQFGLNLYGLIDLGQNVRD